MLGTDKSESSANQNQIPQQGQNSKAGPEETNRVPDSKADGSSKKSGEIGALPLGLRVGVVAPPLKPFKKGPVMANPPSASYQPEIPRKVVDIPNPARLRAERTEPSSDDDGKRLVVGQSISVSGDISACETLVVHGTVETNLTDAVTLEVAESGLFKGIAEVDHATISGTFDGTLKARQTLDVAASGHVKGTIFYNDISIASGGRVQGTIDSIETNDED